MKGCFCYVCSPRTNNSELIFITSKYLSNFVTNGVTYKVIIKLVWQYLTFFDTTLLHIESFLKKHRKYYHTCTRKKYVLSNDLENDYQKW